MKNRKLTESIVALAAIATLMSCDKQSDPISETMVDPDPKLVKQKETKIERKNYETNLTYHLLLCSFVTSRRFFMMARFYGPQPGLYDESFELNHIELLK